MSTDSIHWGSEHGMQGSGCPLGRWVMGGSPEPIIRDRVVQTAAKLVLEPIFEADLEPNAYGYRPQRSAQDAVQKVHEYLCEGYTDVVDADLSKYYDKISHDWLIRFVEHRVGDQRMVRLIQKWLKAGVLERGRWSETEEGTPQGSVISPLLANLYLHYALDLWVEAWRKKATGDVIIVRYADHRFDAKHPRQEPCARIAPARVCAGGVG